MDDNKETIQNLCCNYLNCFVEIFFYYSTFHKHNAISLVSVSIILGLDKYI